MRKNIGRYVLGALTADQHRECLVGEDPVTRGGLLARVDGRARQLEAVGVAPGDFVVVLCGRGSRFWVDLLALWVRGATPICLEADVADDHGANVLEITDARRLCHDGVDVPPSLRTLESVPAAPPNSDTSIRSLDQLPWAGDDVAGDLAGLIFTSGTTGLPKGVPLTHEQLVMNALATRDRLRLRIDDRLMIATPFRFISSISHFIVTLLCGAAFHGVESKLMIKDLMTELSDARITAFGGSPFHVQFVAMAGEERLPALRWVMSSGDHLPVDTIDKLRGAFPGVELHVVYGMAEMGGRICSLPPAAIDDHTGAVGLPISGIEVDIYDDEGTLCPPGEIGELYVQSPFRFDGYLARPDANAAVLSERGFRTGDKGYRDEEGYIFLSGRSDAVFKRSGLKVSAQVITDALKQLEDVEDAFVRSRPDQMEGAVPVAYVVTSDGTADRNQLTRLLRERLAANHIPAAYVAVPGIPRTGSGKVDRRALDALLDELDPA